MKKLFAMLLALCMMCGVVSAGAEEDVWFFDGVPYEELEPKRFEFPYVSYETPGRCDLNNPYETSERDHHVQGYVDQVPCTNTEGNTEYLPQHVNISVSSYDFDILSHYGSLQSFLNGGGIISDSYKRTHRDIVTEDGITLVRRATGTDGFAFTYIWCLGNVGFEISFSDFSNMTINGKPVNVIMPGDDFYLDEIVLPIIRSVVLPDGSTAVSAVAAEATKPETELHEETDTQEIKLGNVHFQIPAELTALEPDGNEEVYLQYLNGADYSVEILLLDYEKAGVPLQVLKGADDQINNLFWCYGVVSNNDQDAALFLCNNASQLEGTMPDGQALVYFGTDRLGLAAHYYRNMGCLVMVLSENESIDGARCCEIALTIASSFRIDGVTEEQMAADAEAARIAAEQAAMQKHIVITNASANIRSAANGSASKITTAYKGDTFPLLGEEGTWYKIDVNGQTGYVAQGLCQIKE